MAIEFVYPAGSNLFKQVLVPPQTREPYFGSISMWLANSISDHFQAPFILMNLILSLQAAYTAPVIKMSQNRQATRDRIEAHNDDEINKKVEEEVRAILEHLESQNQVLRGIYRWLSTFDVPVASKDGQDQDHRPQIFHCSSFLTKLDPS